MAVFEEVAVGWNGKKFVIPADRMMLTIARVEDIITMGELTVYFTSGKLPLAKLSQAFGLILRSAGAKVEDDEVYAGMFAARGKEVQHRAMEAIHALMALMVPPEHLRAALEDANAAGKPEAPAWLERKSSRKRINSRPRRRGG